MRSRLHVYVYGRVQGVFFRANTQITASGLGLTGWVKNLDDGGVEITAEGEKEKLMQLLEWCHNGPDSAKVDSVKKEWEKYKGDFNRFEVRY